MKIRRDEEMVAYAFEMDPVLLSFVPELLANTDVLGANATRIVPVLRELETSEDATVYTSVAARVGSPLPSLQSAAVKLLGLNCSSYLRSSFKVPHLLLGS